VKTAISVPDDVFEEITRRAGDLGISRSELFSTAARWYLLRYVPPTLTEEIDAAVALVAGDTSAADAVAAGRRRLRADAGDW
jgi:metal-responsive CopG/Arc/MetJ family transcriptional regulator